MATHNTEEQVHMDQRRPVTVPLGHQGARLMGWNPKPLILESV